MYDIKMLKAKKLSELIEIAEQIGIKELAGLKKQEIIDKIVGNASCLLYTSPSPRDATLSRMPSSA